ncbi:hypothetical protein DIPPA_23593 [Diplonema papillatum]|nr:hypothetical protein DIPPA_23593 [Diplonema papillatum]
MTRQQCLTGVSVGAIGKLQHSHYYYSQAVPRLGGRWVSGVDGAAELLLADYVVVPPDFVAAGAEAALRDLAAAKRRTGKPLLVGEAYLTEAIARRRRATSAEVAELAVPIPDRLLRKWKAEFSAETRAKHADLLTSSRPANDHMAHNSEHPQTN